MLYNTQLEVGNFSFEPLSPTGLEKRLADFLIANETYAAVDESSHQVNCAFYGFDFTLRVTYGLSIASVEMMPRAGFNQQSCDYLRGILRMMPEFFDTRLNKPRQISAAPTRLAQVEAYTPLPTSTQKETPKPDEVRHLNAA